MYPSRRTGSLWRGHPPTAPVPAPFQGIRNPQRVMSSSMTQEQLHAKLNPCEQYGVVDLSEEEESLGDEEARVIAEFLRSDSRVKLLNLCDNGEITDVGAAALSEMLRANRTLEMLFLKRGKGIGNQGGLSFLKVLVETPAY